MGMRKSSASARGRKPPASSEIPPADRRRGPRHPKEIQSLIDALNTLARKGPAARLTLDPDAPLHLQDLARAVNRILEERQAALELLSSHESQLIQAEKLVSLGTLTAGIAHEINNPMAFLQNNLAVLARYVRSLITVLRAYRTLEDRAGRLPQGDLQESLADIRRIRESEKMDRITGDLGDLVRESHEGADRISKIVSDLREFAHVDESEIEPTDINAILDSALGIMANELRHKAEIAKEYGSVSKIPCAPRRLTQVFLNLLLNAAQAISTQGTIRLRTRESNGTVRVEIEDTGAGIAAEHMPHLFEPFFTTKPAGKGMGLGLYLSYRIVERMGGTLEAESQLGVGSTFRVVLPADRGAVL
ncbi:MAG: histidine kinase [Nitrospirae bacterium]|nr:histidine kinase [Nitrospirota bacterium]